LTGYISKGIALCGTGYIRDARVAFDVASMYTDQDPQTIHFLLLIKVCYICLAHSTLYHVLQAIALFNADEHDEANLLLKELNTGCPKADALACRVVQVSIIHGWPSNTHLCDLHIRHIYVFNLDSKLWVARVTTKPPTTSLPLSIPALSHQNPLMKYTKT
jgi:hypothetical protein